MHGSSPPQPTAYPAARCRAAGVGPGARRLWRPGARACARLNLEPTLSPRGPEQNGRPLGSPAQPRTGRAKRSTRCSLGEWMMSGQSRAKSAYAALRIPHCAISGLCRRRTRPCAPALRQAPRWAASRGRAESAPSRGNCGAARRPWPGRAVPQPAPRSAY
jgi:hypothetical protein